LKLLANELTRQPIKLLSSFIGRWEYISCKLKAAEWGDGVVDQLAQHLVLTQPNLLGFTRRNLFRMRQFYETYQEDKKVSALLTQLPWTHNLIILSQRKRSEEREFYLKMAIQEKWSSRELERQFNTALFERVVLNPVKVSSAVTQTHSPEAINIFKIAMY
jgi:predicted nuclease of restriction endonuclease-like (RecB) superfamily